MKYKAKFSAPEYGFQKPITEGSTFDSNEYGGVFAFIPFTDERFFEPVKTRKFEIEVDEDQMTNFQIYCERPGYWTVTEITENRYLEALKANREVSEEVIQVMSENDYAKRVFKVFESFHEDHTEKFPIIKEMKYWLVAHLPEISGLKEAKSICDSWWNLV